MLSWLRATGIVALLACAVEGPHPDADQGGLEADSNTPDSPPIQLIDPAIPPAVAGEAGWNYEQSTHVDLTGDGRPERVVLTARVELYRGRPAWDDGQPWQVYVEAPDGSRTYLYAQRLQLGTLSLRVSHSAAGQTAAVVLLEELPHRMSVYEVSYGGPGATTPAVRYQRDLDPRGETASPQLP